MTDIIRIIQPEQKGTFFGCGSYHTFDPILWPVLYTPYHAVSYREVGCISCAKKFSLTAGFGQVRLALALRVGPSMGCNVNASVSLTGACEYVSIATHTGPADGWYNWWYHCPSFGS